MNVLQKVCRMTQAALLMCAAVMPAMVYGVDYSAITYDWTDAAGVTHTSPLTEKATTPEQIMALLNAVYVNPEVPGNIHHYEYAPDGTLWPLEEQLSQQDVNYEMQSRIRYTWDPSSKTYYNVGDRAPWVDCEGDVPTPVEGSTVLLVQIKDSWEAEDILEYYSNKDYTGQYSNKKMSEYDRTYQILKDAFESVELLTNSMRVDDDNNPGYMYLIETIKTNRFFFISKGRVRFGDGSTPFYLAFEQLSPGAYNPAYDMVERLEAGDVFGFVHDCYDVFRGDKATIAPYVGQYVPHYAQISGIGSLEAQTMSNLALFIPDKRYKRPDNVAARPNGFLYNSKEGDMNSVKMLAYKAFLTATAKPSATAGYYDVTLDWYTWFDQSKIQADVHELFTVYVVNEDGTRTPLHELIASDTDNFACDEALTANTTLTTYTFRVKKQLLKQDFDFVVTAAPDGSTMHVDTNIDDVIVPGQKQFYLSGVEYRSRYDLASESNVYRNSMNLMPNNEFDAISTEANHYTMYRVSKDATSTSTPIATVTFTKVDDDHYSYSVSYVNQNTTLTFDDVTPETTGTITIDDVFTIIDRFTASTADNEHPEGYTYYLGATDDASQASNYYDVPVFKTTNQVILTGFTEEQVNDDADHSLKEDHEVQIKFDARVDVHKTLYKYDVYRIDGSSYHTQVGKAKLSNGALEVMGYNHMTGHLSLDMGSVPASTTLTPITVYDDLAQCDGIDPQYSIEILTKVRDREGNTVTNHYGCAIHDIPVPDVHVTAEAISRSNAWNNGDGALMGYKTKVTITPDLPADMDGLLRYGVWRIVHNGDETYLNAVDVNSTWQDSWFTELGQKDLIKELQSDEPSRDQTLTFYDIFNARCVQEKVDVDEEEDHLAVDYLVRMYSYRTPSMSGAPRRGPSHAADPEPGDDPAHHYYISDKIVRVNFNYGTTTGVKDIKAEPIATVYYNIMGVPAATPWPGVNIVRTMLSDGRAETVKRLY